MRSKILRGLVSSALLAAAVSPAVAAPLSATSGTNRNVAALTLARAGAGKPVSGEAASSKLDGTAGTDPLLAGLALAGSGFFGYEVYHHDHHHRHVTSTPVSD